MLKLDQAMKLIEPQLSAVAEREGVEIVVTSAERTQSGWMLYYNTVAFVESGDDFDGLLGNIPIEVADDGSIRHQ